MQNLNQENSGSTPEATTSTQEPLDTGMASQVALSEPAAGEEEEEEGEDTTTAAPVETGTVIPPQENETGLQIEEAPETEACIQAVEKETAVQPPSEPLTNSEGMEIDSASKQSAPADCDTNKDPQSDEQTAKKQEKGPHVGRRYVLSKKAMTDPLKIDMFDPPPLSSPHLSLQCFECHIIFSDYKSKKRHLKLSHPRQYEQHLLRDALFACYVCDRHFTNSSELMAHQKSHTEKKPFKCPLCDQAFIKSSELTLHKKNHFGQDGYACTECGKPCKTLTLLKYHRRTHTGERPYVCKECGKRFTMAKALTKHALTHLPEGAEEEGNPKAKVLQNKTDVKYVCSICKATFKTPKTRQHHMKTKHKSSNTLTADQQVKQSAPIITPISISQPALLQLEANGPLQKVDDNIDTEQICRLIESLGNVQKVNQVVILGQVPPHAPPLEVQSTAESVTLNASPVQIDFIGLKQSEPKRIELDTLNNQCNNSLEQTIILEPITPDGQLENPSFSELGSQIAANEEIELTLVPTDQPEQAQGQVMHHILQQAEINAIQSDTVDQMVCQNEVADLKQNLEETVILELTPALIPTSELEQCQTVPQNEISSSSLVPTTELEKTTDQTAHSTVIVEPDTNLDVVPFMPTVELELAPLQTEQQDLTLCPFVPPETLSQTPSDSERIPKEGVDTQIETVSLDQVAPQVDHVVEEAAPQETQESIEQEPSKQESSENEMLADNKEAKEQLENESEVEGTSAKEEVPSQLEIKQVPEVLNVMSAQELVKVRKRKPARAFIFQGYVQQTAGSMPKDDLQIEARPAKRQRKKSHLVVKFGPQSKDKKNKKQRTPPQEHYATQEEKIPTDLSDKKVVSPKKGRKGKKGNKVGHLVAQIKPSSSSKDATKVQQIKDTKKNKIKKQNEEARDCVVHANEHKAVASAVFKKKKQGKIMRKDQPKNAKDGKRKKNLSMEENVDVKLSPTSVDAPGPHIKQVSLLILKGHKQPQLKVHKLDPSKTSGQTQETSPQESHTVPQQSKDDNEPTNNLTEESKKKVGRPKKNQKALSLLSSLQVSRQPPEALPTKPKTTRKRKASSNVETEGIITSHSKRALECNDCGERFSEVSSLQKHKATVHIVESPGLTYTNGNVFEGVSRLYQLSKDHNKVVEVISATADWDTEPEMALEDRERILSFPALIPSPSLPVPPSDVEGSAYEDKGGSKIRADDESDTSPEVHLPSDQLKKYEIPPNVTSESAPCTSTQTRSLETGESLASDESKQGKGSPKQLSMASGVQVATDEDIKEDLLLEVDLVTVGEHNEKDDQVSPQENVPQSESKGSGDESTETFVAPEKCDEMAAETNLTLQTVSCSTRQVEVKEEEEEVLVQRKKEGERGAVTKNTTRGKRRGTGSLKRDAISKKGLGGDSVRESESDKDQSECQVVYEKHPVTSDLEIDGKGDTGTETSQPETHPEFETDKATTPAACLPSVPSTSDQSPEEQVVFELQSVTPSVEEVLDEGGQREGEQPGRETDQSPGIILEKIVTSTQGQTAEKALCLMTSRTKQQQGLDSIAENEVPGNEEIKVEENISDPRLAEATCQDRLSASVLAQHHHDIRTVLVKEESSHTPSEAQATQSSRHIRWNVEPVNEENTPTPLMESGETLSDCRISPEFNSNQCIFYPVKEEEREVLLGDAQSSRGSLTPEGSSALNQTELQTADDEGGHSSQDYQEIGVRGLLSDPEITDFADGDAEEDAERPHPPDLRDFLLQSSDEEDMGVPELSDPQLDSEAEVMAYFYKNQTNGAQQPDQTSQNLPSSSKQPQAPRDAHRNREPIDYFSKYFGWDTWEEIAGCTNKQSNLTNPVTKREVAQFVGIHIAMGTLKFPSPRLYWEDLTKVPLIAEAMPLSRFLELSCKLKLASPAEDPVHINVQKGQHDGDSGNGQKGKTQSSRQNAVSQHDDWQLQGGKTKDLSSSKTQTDPLWKVQPILCRFRAGCRSLAGEGDYAVDQYPLPLTGKMHDSKPALQCTTLIGFGGLLFHVDLKLDLSDKEDAVEKMAPRGSMVFLCRQELSTPAMLERLLVAGVHGAGRVGGARGQIGDEFVSSDGKLMLRRSHYGFILSTAGNGQRNMASLAENFEKAQMSARLSRDLQNLYPIPLTASAPTCWPQAVLWYLTDLALINSWLLYRQDHRAETAPFTLMAFRLEVSKALILCSGSDTQDSVPPQPPTERAQTANEIPNPSLVEESPLPNAATRYDGSGHWPEQLAEGEGGRCRYGDCQRTSRVLCLKCCVFLCISRNHNCFLNFHNQESLGKV